MTRLSTRLYRIMMSELEGRALFGSENAKPKFVWGFISPKRGKLFTQLFLKVKNAQKISISELVKELFGNDTDISPTMIKEVLRMLALLQFLGLIKIKENMLGELYISYIEDEKVEEVLLRIIAPFLLRDSSIDVMQNPKIKERYFNSYMEKVRQVVDSKVGQ